MSLTNSLKTISDFETRPSTLVSSFVKIIGVIDLTSISVVKVEMQPRCLVTYLINRNKFLNYHYKALRNDNTLNGK